MELLLQMGHSFHSWVGREDMDGLGWWDTRLRSIRFLHIFTKSAIIPPKASQAWYYDTRYI